MTREEAAEVIAAVLNRNLDRFHGRPVTTLKVLAHPYDLSASAVQLVRDDLDAVRRAHAVVNSRPDPVGWPARRRTVSLTDDQLAVLTEAGVWP